MEKEKIEGKTLRYIGCLTDKLEFLTMIVYNHNEDFREDMKKILQQVNIEGFIRKDRRECYSPDIWSENRCIGNNYYEGYNCCTCNFNEGNCTNSRTYAEYLNGMGLNVFG